MQDDMLTEAARRLFREQCTPHYVRLVEAGESPWTLWRHLEEAGFGDALVPEICGGAGLSLAQVSGVWFECGACALPAPLAETMVARALLASVDVERPSGPIGLAEGQFQSDGSLACATTRMGRVVDHVLVEHPRGWQLLSVREAIKDPAAFCLDATLSWTLAQVESASLLTPAFPDQLNIRTFQACLAAAQIAGGLTTVFQRTLQYANDRSQFGRPIGKFQAIQHQLAVMSEHVFAARMAAQLGCAAEHELWPHRVRVAVAKARCSQAALAVAEAAHSIHGAIGFTEEYDLQLFTRRLHAWRQTAGTESYWHDVAGNALIQEHRGPTLDLLRATTDTTV